MKPGERMGRKAERRVFHYTVSEYYNRIAHDGFIRPATEGVPAGERPAVWFSVHPVWEPTATKAIRYRETGEFHRATWEEMQVHGPARIEVAPETAPHRWKDYVRLSSASPATCRGLELAAREWGANALHWRVSFEPVPAEKWLAVELWSGTTWKSVSASDRALPRMLLDDPRFAFIATTEAEWAAFRQADVVVGRDAATGESLVVFGRERVKRVGDMGEQGVEALVVRFNPETNELERLAAACLALKGWHELEP